MSSDYCKTPDRRFQIEINTQELKPAGQEYLTNAPVARPISPGMYDTGSGFYDPVFKLIYDYDDPCKSTPIEQAYDNDKQVIYQMVGVLIFFAHSLVKIDWDTLDDGENLEQ